MRRALVLTLTLLVVDGCGPGPTSESPKAPVVVAVNDASTSAPSPEPTRATERPDAGGNAGEEARASGDHAADGHDQLERGLRGDAGPDEDPAHGNFTLADATAGLAGTGPLVATIKTTKGDLKCKLYDDKAPITVANFVGLARGTRPWKDPSGAWVKRPAYDGTRFHRVIPGFMIQGGDPRGDGTGEPGYVIPDERWPGAKHDRAGLLCAANRGANTNGMQFFVTDAKTPHLDNPGNAYTIFGECQPTSVVSAIANEKRDARDRPLADVIITSVEIARGGAKAPTAPKKQP